MLTLSRGDDLLILAPEHGGAIVGWTRRGTHLLRHPSPEAVLLGQPGAMGCFPLVPFCNRIAYRRFTWAGRTYELAANFGDHPHAIHGVGWQRPMAGRERDLPTARYFRCITTRISRLAVRVRGAAYLPSDRARADDRDGSDQSSFGDRPDGTGSPPLFSARHRCVDRIPGGWRVAEPRRASRDLRADPGSGWNHTEGRAVDREPLDNCFTGWHGDARLPGMRIESGPCATCRSSRPPARISFVLNRSVMCLTRSTAPS